MFKIVTIWSTNILTLIKVTLTFPHETQEKKMMMCSISFHNCLSNVYLKRNWYIAEMRQQLLNMVHQCSFLVFVL